MKVDGMIGKEMERLKSENRRLMDLVHDERSQASIEIMGLKRENEEMYERLKELREQGFEPIEHYEGVMLDVLEKTDKLLARIARKKESE